MRFAPVTRRRGFRFGDADGRRRVLLGLAVLSAVLIGAGYLGVALAEVDHWREPGSPCTIAPGAPHHFVIWSAGPDHIHGTADDIRCDR
jgi:hypothetical protein